MRDHKLKRPRVEAEGAEDKPQRSATKTTPLRANTKLASVLAELARGRSLNRFEAYRELRDSVLNTTVSEIQKRGIQVARKEEAIPGFSGRTVYCCRYWLEPEEAAKAANLLGWKVMK